MAFEVMVNLPPNWFAWGFISPLEIVFNPSALRAAWPDFLFLGDR